jgi:3-oxoacyl-[acyl-carrier protein] reductase
MTSPLQGRRVLVTGGATGIGAAAVQVLSEAGAVVVATYHRTPPPSQGGVTWLQCDVRDSAAVDEMVRGAAEQLGGLDVLLHAAGLWQAGIPGQLTGEDIDFLVDTNLKATIFTNQAAYAVMRTDGGGRIINFGSAEAVMGSPISALYATTKGAVQAWTRSAAKAWGAEKVSVIALAPAVKTPGLTVCANSSDPSPPTSSTNRSSRRFPSAAHSEIRSTISDRCWCSCAVRDPASSPDN